MTIFAVALAIYLACLILHSLFRNEKYKNVAGVVCAITLLISLASLTTSMFLSFFLPFKYETKVVRIKPIYSVEDVNSINGRFVIGTGSVDQDIVYYYYVQEKEGLKLEHVSSNDVYIVESDKKPVIETVEKEPVYTISWIEEIIGVPPMKPSVTYHRLIVPKNTVKKVFDLQVRD
ncbi:MULTISPECIES: hypothetical protein [Thermoanaerobacterium]|uniref:DUF4811 domain-containing protein n=3 Tax=Thermoanaerobacterium TaxID=28895 RepID=L0ILS6_THETR|nr:MULTISPECIES: hypothetical protein [Thermoanaerobacterium]AFK94286.1 hypothetical protein Tsac_2739 [Thermoanaerobacterium saccharolyticum JW/SL-YS485]AGB20460.1 hypothetical protein Thethe_02914 [Thermoanaerobacterium thermosaccharolyticum M0795]ETO39079.1 hypothetical protein V518_0786 [Thermoanaerobacterium aotearoense SCUT27]